jgi:hypothetical protein
VQKRTAAGPAGSGQQGAKDGPGQQQKQQGRAVSSIFSMLMGKK